MTTEASTDATLTTDATLKQIIAEQEEIFVRRQPKSQRLAIFASAVLVFSGVIDDFVIVDLLSSNAGNTPMSVLVYSTQRGGNGGPALNALGTIMLVMSFIIAIIGYIGYRFLTRGERGSRIEALTTIAGSEG